MIVDELIRPNMLLVYGIRATNDQSMEYRYVGLTSNFKTRLVAHMTSSTNERSPAYNSAKYKWMRRHLHLVTFDLLGEYSTVSEMQYGEMQWIHILSARGHRLLNATLGGEGTYGWEPHEEWRKKQSMRMSDPKNNKYMFKSGPEHPGYGKPSPLLGSKRTEEFCQNMSAARGGSGNSFYGKTHSAETKKILSDTFSGSKSANAKLSDEDVIEIRQLHSSGVPTVALAERFGVTASTISRASSGRGYKNVAGQLGSPPVRIGARASMYGKQHSEETKRKMSESSKGQVVSKSTILKRTHTLHKKNHSEKIKDTCKWCLGADLQTEIDKESKLHDQANDMERRLCADSGTG